MNTKNKFLVLMLLLGAFTQTVLAQKRIGIIGLDTSHATAFTKIVNGEESPYKDFEIVAAYPYGSKTIQSSMDRIPEYTKEVKKYGVKIVNSIAELLDQVDCVMLETNDGNVHLEQAIEVFKAGKTVFIDKPIGGNLAQAIAIFELAKKYNVPVFTSSALRFSKQTLKIRDGQLGEVIGADCYSPASEEPSHSDFTWYGIHGVETLFTVMGTGCVSVNRMHAEGTDIVVGLWKDGRIGTFRGIREGKGGYGGTAFTSTGIVPVGTYDGYGDLLDEILRFFNSGKAPVSADETLEIFTFMEASIHSKENEGKIISMKSVYEEGKKQAERLIEAL